MSGVAFLDLGRRFASMQPDLDAAIERVVRSGRYLLGAETEQFEHAFAAFCGRRHAVALSSGTEALRLALVALDIAPGDEVIVPAFTAVPTAAAVCAAGGVPVFVDVDRETAGIDVAAAAAAVTSRTRAVIPVHLYGRPMEIPTIGVPVIEDAAQAHGAVDRSAPSMAAAYSFYPTKNLGGIGDGGAVVTDDAELARRIRRLGAHGLDGEYEHVVISGNSRLSELEAAVLRVGLGSLDAGNERRRTIAAGYRDAAPAMQWQASAARHVYHLCVARVASRPAFRSRVPFDTAVHYPRALHQQPAYAHFTREPYPEAEAWAAECVSLPCYPEMTDEEVRRVCSALAAGR